MKLWHSVSSIRGKNELPKEQNKIRRNFIKEKKNMLIRNE